MSRAAFSSVGAVGAAQARQRAASSYDRALLDKNAIRFILGFRNEKRAVIDRAYRKQH
jgi:hypothetical protein